MTNNQTEKWHLYGLGPCYINCCCTDGQHGHPSWLLPAILNALEAKVEQLEAALRAVGHGDMRDYEIRRLVAELDGIPWVEPHRAEDGEERCESYLEGRVRCAFAKGHSDEHWSGRGAGQGYSWEDDAALEPTEEDAHD